MPCSFSFSSLWLEFLRSTFNFEPERMARAGLQHRHESSGETMAIVVSSSAFFSKFVTSDSERLVALPEHSKVLSELLREEEAPLPRPPRGGALPHQHPGK